MANADSVNYGGRSNRYTSDRPTNPGLTGTGAAKKPNKASAPPSAGPSLGKIGVMPNVGNKAGY